MDKIKIGKFEISKDLLLFLIISVLMGVVSAVESTSLANRLYDELDFTVMQRAALETPREFPGFITVVLIAMFNSLGDRRTAAVANIFGGIGLICFGMVPNEYSLILVTLLMYSTGQHLYLPLSNTIAMTFSEGENFGKKLGQVQSLGSFSIIIASAGLFVLYRFVNVTYSVVFTIAGIAMALAGILFLLMKSDKKEVDKSKKFVFEKRFKTYYKLAIVNGARKQITITFAPWLLIDVFGRPVSYITALFFIVCVLNLFFKPWFGKLIDEKGEKKALRLEAVVMAIACIGFAFAGIIFPFKIALGIVVVCYVLDKLMESAAMARATYVRRNATNPQDVAKTISMGQSMDHVLSMLIPLVAGFAWYAGGNNGYVYVFVGGIVISGINFYLASQIEDKKENDENEEDNSGIAE